ncbi:hypothetical protein FRACYDRAFT_238823 [Fragilariopsis cylindrus CCMP1102]|uniref:DUF1279 domain-containing protein n=1 Tax=Fragilariopsis cylindrus CCMP1102 TaxID=635003 RepID=A0A1E7FDW0_9STRA|nr:hypothetical protein FRACYDRAFT_238823 [Fragilariopsis cylindrus CCMP1102]|eukprot:OEU16235.1 hypothetical protein FRACYDRAFT_238823 [Fragilariopsis cylindrus CCMP1102]
MTTIRPILKIPSRISTRINCCQFTTKRLSSSRAVLQNNHHPKTTIAKKIYLQDSSSSSARSPLPAARLIRAFSTETGRGSWWKARGNLSRKDKNPNTSIIASTLYYDPYRSSYRMISSTTLSSEEKLHVGKNDEDDAQTDSSGSSSSSNTSNNKFHDIPDIDDEKDNNNNHIVTVKSSQTKLTERKPNKQSFRSMLRQYGPIFIGTYGVVYVSTVFGLFMGIQSGILDATSIMDYLSGTASSTADAGGGAGGGGVDVDPDNTIQSAASTMTYMVEFLEYYSWTKPLAPIVQENPWTANFGIAWIMTKFTEPIRLGLAVAVTPSIAKKIGYGRTAQKNSPPSSQSQSQSPDDADNDQSTSSSSSTEKK